VLLTVEAARRRGLEIAAIVLNRTVAQDDPSVPHNAAEIARLTGAKVVGPLAFKADIAVRAVAVQAALADEVKFSTRA
jgi:dethiobiotin synthetase